MTKTIETLKKDLHHVLTTGEGFTSEISEWVGEMVSQATLRQMTPREFSKPYLRMSNLGQPCDRKLWYSLQQWSYEKREKLLPQAINKFVFGDLIEAWTLGLIKASGHRLEGVQDTMTINGIRGSRDCVIDGVTSDVKSASTMAMNKFRNNGLLQDDPFGYLSQLSSYVAAAKDDPIVTDKTRGAFVAVDKQFGTIEVDIYDLSSYVETKGLEVEQKKLMVKQKEPPPRGFEDVPDGKSGNRKLGTNCSYCEFRNVCYPDLQTYIYSSGPRFFTQIVREPKVLKDN